MINKVSKNETRKRRHARVRAKVSGTATCPRLNVFRSNSHIFAQIIDDTNGTTLVSSSSLALKLESSSNIVYMNVLAEYTYNQNCYKVSIDNVEENLFMVCCNGTHNIYINGVS